MDIRIYPLERAVLDGASIALGMERPRVEAAIGAGQAAGSRQLYYDGELAIDYDSTDRVAFIEFLGGVDGTLKPMIDGISVFDADAEEVIALLRRKNHGGAETAEGEYALRFHAIGVGVYREITPADILEMIEEMQANGIPAERNDDLEADKRRADHWATFGMGAAGYYGH